MYKSPRINISKLSAKIPDLKSQVKFLQENLILPTTQTCDPCNQIITKLSNEGSKVFFRCGKCKSKISIRKGTVLYNSKLSLRRFILLVYSFTQHNWTYKQVENEVCITSDEDESEDAVRISPNTINNFTKYFREIISDDMIEKNQSDNKIGGIGMTVELDESLFGKRKYHRGTIEGRRFAWVLGGVCRETKEIFIEICPDNKRDKATLMEIIQRRVEKGTKIITDGWAAYKDMESYGYEWDWVNHSKEFVKHGDREVHTQRIEGTWFRIKRWLPSSGRYDLESYFPIFLWKIDCEKRNVSQFWELIEIISKSKEEKFLELKSAGKDDEVEKVPCVYCGGMYKKRGLQKHYKSCNDAP